MADTPMPDTEADTGRRDTRDVVLLACCQALFVSTLILTITVASLAASALLDDARFATLPQATIPLVSMLVTVPAALLMHRVGRRAGFLLGAACGVASGVVCSVALVLGSYLLFLGGVALLGVYQAFATYYRFAVADHAPAHLQARSVSFVLAGGVVAAVLGPTLGAASRDVVGTVPYLGSYLATIALNLAAVVLLARLRLRAHAPPAAAPRPDRRALLASPRFLLALACCAIGQGTMALVMTATPLAMLGHGHSLGFASLVISWHVLAMFVPSFFSGPLMERVGLRPVLVAGLVLMAGSMAVAMFGTTRTHFAVALVVNGLAWNFLFVGGSTLLAGIADAAERTLAQGMNEFATFGASALATFGSGALYHAGGWSTLNGVGIAAVAFVALLFVALGRRPFEPPDSA